MFIHLNVYYNLFILYKLEIFTNKPIVIITFENNKKNIKWNKSLKKLFI